MLNPHAANLASAVRILSGMRAWLRCDSAVGAGNPALLAVLIKQIRPDVDRLPVSRTVKDQLKVLQADAERANDTAEHNRALGTRLEVFLDGFISDLRDVLFFAIDESQRDLYEQPEPLFGKKVIQAFPKAERDIAAAGRCIAVEEWTAAVFHLMRASELALQRLATRLKVPFADRKTWGELLKKVDGQIKIWENMPRTAVLDKRIAYYSAARADLAAFNFAWRRHVAHGRGVYDEREARLVFTHIRSFMERLAAGLPR